MDGILIVDKPKGPTSHDIVDLIRKKFGLKKVGHAGTLDPQATGVLVILLNKFTKRSAEFINHDKEYQARLTLETKGSSFYSLTELENVFNQFLGQIEQIPPMFSALKHKGKRLYQLARQGLEVERPARQVCIHRLKIIQRKAPDIDFMVSCSKGTYIRTLCQDIAQKLGCSGYMSQLRRTRSGPFVISQAISIQRLNSFTLEGLGQIVLENI